MSLQIGWTDQPTVTSRERIVLNSATYSNMIVMGNDVQDATAIAFDANQRSVLGRIGNQFYIQNRNGRIASFSSTEASFPGSLSIGRDLVVDGIISSTKPLTGSSLTTCNITVIAAIPFLAGANQPYITVQRNNGTPVLTTSMNNLGDTTLCFDGNVGIGTFQTRAKMDVEGGARFRDAISVGGPIQTSAIINALSNNEIDMSMRNVIRVNTDNTIIRGNTTIQGDLNVAGRFEFDTQGVDNFEATFSLTTQSLIMSNLAPQRPSIGILHRGYDTIYNILDMKVRPSESLSANPIYDAFTLDYLGRLGIGTGLPQATLHVVENLNHARSNMFHVSGRNPESQLVYNQSGFLGIGTTSPTYRLHLHASNTSDPLFGITNATTSRAPFISALSNDNTQVFSVSHRGGVTIGDIQPNDAWNLLVASNLRVPFIQTQTITGDPAFSRVIQFDRSSMCNVATWQGCNVIANTVRATSNINDFIYTVDWSIPEFDVFNTRGMFHVKIPVTHIQSSNVIFAANRTNINETSEGRVRIYADSDTSAALLVSGTKSTVYATIRAPSNPQLLLKSTTPDRTATVELNNADGGLKLLTSDSTTNPFVLKSDGLYFMDNKVRVSSTGRLIIGNNIPDVEATAGLYVRSDIRFDSNNNARFVFNNATGNIGIGTNVPDYPFHAAAPSVFTRSVRLLDAPLEITDTNGRVAIGSNIDSRYRLLVDGDVNFTGTLTRNGTFYGFSQWVSDGNGVYIQSGSNVGIGTNATPQNFGLYVQNPAMFNSNVTIRGLVTTQGSINSISDGTIKTNLVPLSDSLSYIHQLTGYKYDRMDTGIRECGLIAQEVEKVVPELVRRGNHGESGADLLSIAYGNMAALFVEAIKKLDDRLTNIEKLVMSQSQRS